MDRFGIAETAKGSDSISKLRTGEMVIRIPKTCWHATIHLQSRIQLMMQPLFGLRNTA